MPSNNLTARKILTLAIGTLLVSTSSMAETREEMASYYGLFPCEDLLRLVNGSSKAYSAGDEHIADVEGVLKPRQRLEVRAEWEQQKIMMRDVATAKYKEKNCATATATATAPSVASRPLTPNATAAADGTVNALGATLGPLSPGLAQSLGHTGQSGTLVVEVKQAQPGGLQPLDVILEVSGQAIKTPSDVEAIARRTRQGFGVEVRVWRSQKNVDVSAKVQSDTSTAAGTIGVNKESQLSSTAAQLPAVQSSTPTKTNYCFAWMGDNGGDGPDTQITRVWTDVEIHDPAIMKIRFDDFVAKVRAAHPNRFNPFQQQVCVPSQGLCSGGELPFKAGKSHVATMLCYESEAETKKIFSMVNATPKKLLAFP